MTTKQQAFDQILASFNITPATCSVGRNLFDDAVSRAYDAGFKAGRYMTQGIKVIDGEGKLLPLCEKLTVAPQKPAGWEEMVRLEEPGMCTRRQEDQVRTGRLASEWYGRDHICGETGPCNGYSRNQ